MVWISYISEGRDKYVYDTSIIGLYQNENKAEKETLNYLIENNYILEDFILYDQISDREININEIFEIYPFLNNQKYKEDFTENYDLQNDEKCYQLLITAVKDSDLDIFKIVENYNNSYYQDGWDLIIKEINIIN